MLMLRSLIFLRKTQKIRYVNIRNINLTNIGLRPRNPDEEFDDKPIKYSSSGASKWQAQYSRTGSSSSRLWYEPYVIIGSVAALLIYFCILREENDIDLELQKSLYERIDGLEEHQLRVLLDYNVTKGLETERIIERLKAIEESKARNM